MNQPPKLLVVDDNPVVPSGFSEWLRSARFDVLEARNSAERLHETTQHRPDLVPLHVMLPDLGGVNLCRRFNRPARWNNLTVRFGKS